MPASAAAPVGAELERVARTGRWDRSRGWRRSKTRMAVLLAAADRGWQLADVRAAIASQVWPGPAGLHRRPPEPGRLARLLPAEWRQCTGKLTRRKSARMAHQQLAT